MQIKKLASALDLTLFEPDGRGIRLTPAGVALRDACAELMRLFGNIDERLEPFRRREPDVLRLAAGGGLLRAPSRRAGDVHIAPREELLHEPSGARSDGASQGGAILGS